jgi:hypothetical protein
LIVLRRLVAADEIEPRFILLRWGSNLGEWILDELPVLNGRIDDLLAVADAPANRGVRVSVLAKTLATLRQGNALDYPIKPIAGFYQASQQLSSWYAMRTFPPRIRRAFVRGLRLRARWDSQSGQSASAL